MAWLSLGGAGEPCSVMRLVPEYVLGDALDWLTAVLYAGRADLVASKPIAVILRAVVGGAPLGITCGVDEWWVHRMQAECGERGVKRRGVELLFIFSPGLALGAPPLNMNCSEKLTEPVNSCDGEEQSK